ncbi:MAG: hypothetical protein K9L88_10010 [Chromatiaceae bacterium]|nr:hypothetical protein [Chromatiaceae bacterium]MCF8016820.1 hypothetical protein [Chromatiaceae bacterium]
MNIEAFFVFADVFGHCFGGLAGDDRNIWNRSALDRLSSNRVAENVAGRCD